VAHRNSDLLDEVLEILHRRRAVLNQVLNRLEKRQGWEAYARSLLLSRRHEYWRQRLRAARATSFGV
jgi:hypothetical protein